MKKKTYGCLLVAMLVTLTACGKISANKAQVTDFTPIIDNDGADPWILQATDHYYYVKTTGTNVTLQRSDELTQVATGEKKIIFEAGTQFESIWAPEIHYLDETWVCYFAANKARETQRMYAVTNPAADPFEGEWTLTEIAGMDDKFAIDGTVFEIGDKRYFVWSGWEGYENVAQNLYLSEMLSPTAVKAQKTKLSQPEFDWEKRQTPWINEGPQILVHDQKIYLVYSASGSWDNDYCLGLLTLDEGRDPLEETSWQKSAQPIFKSENEVLGPGHNGFVKSKDGSEDWLIYHAARWDHSGWNRSIRLQKITWTKAGQLSLGVPLAENELRHLPNGEPPRYRLLADQAQQNGDFEEIADEWSLSEKAIRGFFSPSDSVTWEFQAPNAGRYDLLIYLKQEDAPSAETNICIDVTVADQTEKLPLPTAQYYQPIQVQMDLAEGTNEITIQSDIGIDPLCLDRLEIVPRS